MGEAKGEHLKGALIKAKTNLAPEKGRRKVEAAKSKKKLVEVEKKVKERMGETRKRSRKGPLKLDACLWRHTKHQPILLWRRLKHWRPLKCPSSMMTMTSLVMRPSMRVQARPSQLLSSSCGPIS